MANFHDFKAITIDGDEKSLRDFAGKTLLVVNVASQCGLTPQYKGLEELQRKYKGRGFAVLGFPCNQFASQEPGSDEEIKNFCETRFDVTFPLFSKVDVNGDDRHPVYEYLTSQETQPDGPGDIKWNFAKFIVNKQGEVVARFDPAAEPTSKEVTKAIEEAL
jgi:glutathione peroxidase